MSHQRKQTEKARLKKLARATQTKYRGGAYWDENLNRYVRWTFSRKSKTPTRLKHQSNKKVRHTKKLSNNGGYRKVFDYWWILS